MKFKKIAAFLMAASLISGGLVNDFSYKINSPVKVSASETNYDKTTEGFVTRMYDVVLGRTPDPTGLNDWVTKLNSRKLAAADIVYGFFNSQEYIGKQKSISEQVTDCYHAMLGREPDEHGFKDWVGKLSIGMTLDAICNGFVGSQEFKNLCALYGINPGSMALKNSRDKNYMRTYFVYRLYDNCLGRTPDTGGLESWCKKLESGMTGSQIAEGFLHSKEFKDNHYDNEDYVYILYYTMLGRSPDPSGLENWVNKLNFTETRERVANGFLFSDEFKKQCAEAGISVGKKIAEKDSSFEWQFNINILKYFNTERKARGLSVFTTRQDFWEDVAMVRAREVSYNIDSTETRPDGRSWDTILEDASIWEYSLGECYATGFNDAKELVDGWIESQKNPDVFWEDEYSILATGYIYDASKSEKHFIVHEFFNY